MTGRKAQNRVNILGVGFDPVSIGQAASQAFDIIKNNEKAYVVTPNPEIVMLCRENPSLHCAVNEADIVLPDGIGVIHASKILGTPILNKVPGIDFAETLIGMLAKENKSIFLFGAKPGIAEKAAENLSASHPGLVIAGVCDGYFMDDLPIIEKINLAAPDFLLVCLGSPKQEIWMHTRRPRISAPLLAGLGGSLDVFAGAAKRAPRFYQRLGLEWLYRLIKEPGASSAWQDCLFLFLLQ